MDKNYQEIATKLPENYPNFARNLPGIYWESAKNFIKKSCKFLLNIPGLLVKKFFKWTEKKLDQFCEFLDS